MAEIRYFQINIQGYRWLEQYLKNMSTEPKYNQLWLDLNIRGRSPGHLFLSTKTVDQEKLLSTILRVLNINFNEYSAEGLEAWLKAVYSLPLETDYQEE